MDQCTGYSQATIGLKVPPGIGGLAPGVALRYNCGSTDMLNQYWIADGNPTSATENARTRLQASPVGLGWQLDFGAVFRSPESDPLGHPLSYLVHGNRNFELAWVDGTTFRTKPDDFMRVRKLTGPPNDCASHEYWLIETRDGTRYRYGYNADSGQRAARWQFAPSTASRRIAPAFPTLLTRSDVSLWLVARTCGCASSRAGKPPTWTELVQDRRR